MLRVLDCRALFSGRILYLGKPTLHIFTPSIAAGMNQPKRVALCPLFLAIFGNVILQFFRTCKAWLKPCRKVVGARGQHSPRAEEFPVGNHVWMPDLGQLL